MFNNLVITSYFISLGWRLLQGPVLTDTNVLLHFFFLPANLFLTVEGFAEHAHTSKNILLVIHKVPPNLAWLLL